MQERHATDGGGKSEVRRVMKESRRDTQLRGGGRMMGECKRQANDGEEREGTARSGE